MKRLTSLITVFLLGGIAPSFGQVFLDIDGKVDSTTESLKVYYTTDEYETVDSIYTDRWGNFNHRVKAKGYLPQLRYHCWVEKCTPGTFTDTTLDWNYDSAFLTLRPRLSYCDTVIGCLAGVSTRRFKVRDSVWYVAQGEYLGKNIKSSWDMGDGTLKSGKDSAHHIYKNPGRYTLTYMIRDTVSGCTDTTSTLIETHPDIGDCEAVFNLYIDQTDTTNVLVYEKSTGYELNFIWAFGDGDSGLIREPTHRYEETGQYRICLTVFNDYCSDRYCELFEMKKFDPTDSSFTISVISKAASVHRPTQNPDRFTIFPNPSHGAFTINSDGKKVEVMSVRDVSGRAVLYTAEGNEAGCMVRLEDAGNGVYFVVFEVDGEVSIAGLLVR